MAEIAVAPSNPEVMYATNGLQIYRTDNGGESWRNLSLGTQVRGHGLVVHPTDENIVVLVSFGYMRPEGTMLSRDGGKTWEELKSPQDPELRLSGEQAFFSADGKQLYVVQSDSEASYSGLLKSADLGRAWSLCEVPKRVVESVTVSPFQSGRLVGHFLDPDGRGTWQSTDDCRTWSPVEHHQYVLMERFFFGDSEQELWGVGNNTLYRSLDSGATWTESLTTDHAIEDVAIDPDDRDRLYALTVLQAYASSDNGETWQPRQIRGRPYARRIIAPSGPEAEVIALSRRGVEKSLDGGRSWRALNRGIVTESVIRIRIHPERPEEMWSAGWGGLARSMDGGRTWRWVETGLEYSGGFTDVLIDPRDGTIYAAGFARSLLRSSDNGQTWIPDGEPQSSSPFHLALDPHQPERLYAGVPNLPRIMIYENGGAEVRARDVGTLAYEIYVDPEVAGRLIFSGVGGIWVLDDLDDVLAEPRLTFATGGFDNLLARVPSNPKSFYAMHPDTGNVWRSLDSGETWTEIQGDLDSQVAARNYTFWTWQLVVSPHDPNELYYANGFGYGGLWRSRDAGVTWHPVAESSPSTQTVTLAAHDSQVLWAGTRASGIYQYDNGPLPACDADDALCMRSGRFEVVVDWQNAAGESGRAHRVLNDIDTSGLFWFFDDQNWELMVKVLDGCALNNHFWVFSAATTNVEYRLRVEDRWSGLSRTYFNTLGELAEANTDTEALPSCGTEPPAGADTSPPVVAQGDGGTAVDLQAERFRVSVAWDTGSSMGDGRLATLGTEDSGIFWFFNPSNWEMLVKVLDGCAVNGHFWVLAATTSDVGYRLRVEDLVTGDVQFFDNPPGTAAPALAATEAFAGCGSRRVSTYGEIDGRRF